MLGQRDRHIAVGVALGLGSRTITDAVALGRDTDIHRVATLRTTVHEHGLILAVHELGEGEVVLKAVHRILGDLDCVIKSIRSHFLFLREVSKRSNHRLPPSRH